MLSLQLAEENPTIDADLEGSDLAAFHGDPILGFARVISQVKSNTRQFRGWGPNH